MTRISSNIFAIAAALLLTVATFQQTVSVPSAKPLFPTAQIA